MATATLRDLHAAPPAGMRPYIVMFKSWRGEDGPRYEQTVSQYALVADNRQKLLDFIQEKGLQPFVSNVAPGTAFGAVGVMMTPAAARAVEQFEDVERVIAAY